MRNKYYDLTAYNSRLENNIQNEKNEFYRNCDKLLNQTQIEMKRISLRNGKN